jgi:hypothetical protein
VPLKVTLESSDPSPAAPMLDADDEESDSDDE